MVGVIVGVQLIVWERVERTHDDVPAPASAASPSAVHPMEDMKRVVLRVEYTLFC